MIKKRRSFEDSSTGADWKRFTENIEDFVNSLPSKRLTLNSNKVTINERNVKHEKNVSFLTDEGNISWVSSDNDDDSKQNIKENLHSPVIANSKQFISVDGQCVKSTPAGSPILSQNNIFTGKVLEPRRRRLSLVPLSPITPGVHSNYSFPNTSRFSFSIHEESKIDSTSSDHTPLALPLPDSDEEVEVCDQISSNCTTQHDIEVISTQTTNAADSTHISTLEDSFESDASDNDDTMHELSMSVNKPRGSVWLEGVLDRLENDGQSIANRSAIQPSISYDSTKKSKFVKNGMAERLQRLIKQEQTQKVLFQHQVKDLQKSDREATQPCIKLKVLSHHKDSQLHILECKVISKGQLSVEEKGFCTVILRDQEVVENNLDLMKTFIVYPPWKELHIKQHNFPVLVCVYHILVDTESTSAATSQSAFDSQDNAALLVLLNNNWTRDCESLLEALEKQNAEAGICLVATVQRQYKQVGTNEIRRVWLCEDAFGVFFELSLESSLGDDVTWSRLIEHGEGQRIYFQKIFLIGRTTRDRSPALFEIIDSVWDSEGFGLLQVQNSQSQSDDSESHDCVQAPSFCYRFAARRWQSTCHCSSIPTAEALSLRFSDLNRPRMNGSTKTDVLYHPCALVDCSEIQKLTPSSSERYSICGQVFHVHKRNEEAFDDDLLSQSTRSAVQVFVANETAKKASDIVSITVNYPHSDLNLLPGHTLIAQDIIFSKGEGFRTDYFSNILYFQNSETLDSFPSHLYPHVNSKVSCHIKPLKLCKLCKEIEPDCFTTVKGVICGLSKLQRTSCSYEPNSLLVSKNASALQACQGQPSNDDVKAHSNDLSDFQFLVMVSFNVKVKLKVLPNTAKKFLSEDCAKVLASSSLNGRKFGPVNSYVYAKYVKTHMTLFYGEEVL